MPRTGTGKNVTALHDMKTAIGNVVGTESGKVVDARETATVKGTGTRARGIGTGKETAGAREGTLMNAHLADMTRTAMVVIDAHARMTMADLDDVKEMTRVHHGAEVVGGKEMVRQIGALLPPKVLYRSLSASERRLVGMFMLPDMKFTRRCKQSKRVSPAETFFFSRHIVGNRLLCSCWCPCGTVKINDSVMLPGDDVC